MLLYFNPNTLKKPSPGHIDFYFVLACFFSPLALQLLNAEHLIYIKPAKTYLKHLSWIFLLARH